MALFYISLGIVVLLAIAFLGASFVRRDKERSIGYLSKETVKRDRYGRARDGDGGTCCQPLTRGRDIERAAELKRKGG